jgi:hypothetical protein
LFLFPGSRLLYRLAVAGEHLHVVGALENPRLGNILPIHAALRRRARRKLNYTIPRSYHTPGLSSPASASLSRFATTFHQFLDGLAALGNADPLSAAWFPIWSELVPSDGLAALGNADPLSALAVLLWLAAIEDGTSTFAADDDSWAVLLASAVLASCGNGFD